MASRITTRTVYGSALQTERGLGLSHNVMAYTTLNQAISENTIMANLPSPLTLGMEMLPDYDYTTDSDSIFTKYICIGNGGHKSIVNATDAIPYTLPVAHKATDSGLYNMIPFVVRPVADDLTITERSIYGLRRTLNLGGVLYAAYFARKLDYGNVTPTTNITNVVGGESSTEQFVPTINNLKPSKPTEDTTYTGSYANITAPVVVTWTEDQIQDIKDACALLFNNENLAIISEIALCSGVKKPIAQKYPNTGTQNPAAVAANTYFEIVACQVSMFISTYVPLATADQEYTLSLDLGATEPLFGTSAT
ncbi:MAG: hypothetical protein [Bacteriophage sp.]|nr:MAG: hypothetical protein [Bacteriophage sp.]